MEHGFFKYLILLFGWLLVIGGADYKRTGESKIKIFTWDWFLQGILLIAGVLIISANSQTDL